MNNEMKTAEQAAVLQPVSQDFLDRMEPSVLKTLGLDSLATLGEVLEDTFEMNVLERQKLDGIVIPWEFDGMRLPDDFVIVRYTALVVPNEEQLAAMEAERLEDFDGDE